jgi:hypothetical protein
MNDRLRDRLQDADPALARAAELVTSIPAIPRTDARKERVRKAVLATQPRRAWLPLLLRPGVAIAILLVTGAVAAATMGRQAILRSYQQLMGRAAAPVMKEREAPKPSVQAPPEATREPAVMPVPAPVAPPAPVAAPAKATGDPVRKVASRAPAPAHPSESPAELPSAAPSESVPPAKAAPAQETVLVMAAVRALRRERDPARAGVLLDDYLRRYPNGVLAEEALALAIEAASARGDVRAAALARTYLQRYPQGRFLRAARAAE